MNNDITPATQAATPPPTTPGRGRSALRIAGLMLLTVLLSVGLTIWLVTAYLFPTEFKPVTLNQSEQQQLERKLQRLDTLQHPPGKRQASDGKTALTPERYSEEGASREIALSERELNALLANNTELASRLAIDLADDLASAKLLVPLDPELPLLGGKTLKLTAGVEMRYAEGRPVIILKGISLWGVPLPNAWLGNMKNIDLVQEFGSNQGFWQAFADGVEKIEIAEGKLRIRLKE
ncbi:MAG: arginine N-succinyltransferase [Gammaproteobacteria bacterium]|nr:arginine N-succinyltransferase [Gammaproteobacteria bacterium]